MEENKVESGEDEHIIVKKENYILKKVVAIDLIVANNRIKTIAISGVLISILIYGTFVFNQTISMIATLAGIIIYGINMIVSERKIKYYESKYNITRPPGVMSMLKKTYGSQPLKEENKHE